MNENSNLPEDDSSSTNLLALLRDDTICGVDGIVRVRREGIARMAQHYACSLKRAMIVLLRQHNIWPERFYRNVGALNSREMARLLESRVFIAGCGALGGHVAALLARMGVGSLRLCDPDVFEESNLNRQYFCTEQTLGIPKVLACRDGLLGLAPHMEIDAREVAADPENLPELLFGCDAVVDCLDSIPRKKMLEEAACAKGIPFVHGSVLGNEGFAFGAEPGVMRLASLYPYILPGNEPAEGQGILVTAASGTACLMASLLVNILGRQERTNSPLVHLDCDVPDIEHFE